MTMGETAENVAARFGVSPRSSRSVRRARASARPPRPWPAGRLADEIVPVGRT